MTKNKGLYNKFSVIDEMGQLVVEPTFTIKYSDPVGRMALACYAQLIEKENPILAKDILTKLRSLESREEDPFWVEGDYCYEETFRWISNSEPFLELVYSKEIEICDESGQPLFDVVLEEDPGEPAVMYYSDGSGHPGTPGYSFYRIKRKDE